MLLVVVVPLQLVSPLKAACVHFTEFAIRVRPREIIEAQLGSADYSANKIRTTFKRNTEAFKAEHHAFCDSLKKLFGDIMPYTKVCSRGLSTLRRLRRAPWLPSCGELCDLPIFGLFSLQFGPFARRMCAAAL